MTLSVRSWFRSLQFRMSDPVGWAGVQARSTEADREAYWAADRAAFDAELVAVVAGELGVPVDRVQMGEVLLSPEYVPYVAVLVERADGSWWFSYPSSDEVHEGWDRDNRRFRQPATTFGLFAESSMAGVDEVAVASVLAVMLKSSDLGEFMAHWWLETEDLRPLVGWVLMRWWGRMQTAGASVGAARMMLALSGEPVTLGDAFAQVVANEAAVRAAEWAAFDAALEATSGAAGVPGR